MIKKTLTALTALASLTIASHATEIRVNLEDSGIQDSQLREALDQSFRTSLSKIPDVAVTTSKNWDVKVYVGSLPESRFVYAWTAVDSTGKLTSMGLSDAANYASLKNAIADDISTINRKSLQPIRDEASVGKTEASRN